MESEVADTQPGNNDVTGPQSPSNHFLLGPFRTHPSGPSKYQRTLISKRQGEALQPRSISTRALIRANQITQKHRWSYKGRDKTLARLYHMHN
jgi:hypothetical protein